MNTEPEQPEDPPASTVAPHGARALWNKRELEAPTAADALVVARALRIEGNREAPAGGTDREGLPGAALSGCRSL